MASERLPTHAAPGPNPETVRGQAEACPRPHDPREQRCFNARLQRISAGGKKKPLTPPAQTAKVQRSSGGTPYAPELQHPAVLAPAATKRAS